VVVGSPYTFGKGTVQAVVPLPRDLGAIKVTTGMFFLPSGSSTQQKGVGADIHVPSVLEGIDIGEKTLDYSLPPQSVPEFLSQDVNTDDADERWTPVDPKQLPTLAAKSRERVAKNPVMVEVNKELAEAKKEPAALKLSEIRKKAQENGGADAKARDRQKAEREKREEAFIGEAADILADLISLNSGTLAQQSR
jgi:carboxyl-terminal processing protease